MVFKISTGVEFEMRPLVLTLKDQAVEMLIWLSEAKSSAGRFGSAWMVARFREGRAEL